MIYKCKNCGREYDTPTDYCECGNNSFEIIGEEAEITPSAAEEEYDEYGERITHSEQISPKNNSDLELLYKPDFKYTKKENQENKQNVLPIIIFIISLIISIILIIAAISSPTKNKDNIDEIKNVAHEISKEEPKHTNIEDFWDNTPAEAPDANKTQKIETSQKPVQQQKTVQKQKPVQKQNTSPQAVKQTPPKPNIQTKPVKTNENKTANSVKEQPKPEQKAQKSEQKTQKPQENNPTQEDKAKLNTYKANLRQYLFSAFPILTVQGSGTASVGFSISSEVKLLNRRFVSQSDNKSLNDAMYHMLMKTPTYTAPPSSYKGEEIILEMKFNNGQYSFSYLK